ncbi:hypothetical protein EVAR_2457_1 [Eumeta japonica]|uniref:Uncharacterized protein n=1 Tax=Eumeta variegata TaxID=151549 RepID=A0A4C1SR78_EUMVA|nr:hypothetical protein EVAR_2457_1 [Eumeta japonica]
MATVSGDDSAARRRRTVNRPGRTVAWHYKDACPRHALTCGTQPTADPRIYSSVTNPYPTNLMLIPEDRQMSNT